MCERQTWVFCSNQLFYTWVAIDFWDLITAVSFTIIEKDWTPSRYKFVNSKFGFVKD
jgi:hypothetical protein